MNMFGTQNLRNAMVIGDISPLPHSRDVRGRSEALEKEKDLYRSRAMAESKQRAALVQYERQQKEEMQRRREQEIAAESERKSREAATAAELQQSQSKRRQIRSTSDEKDSRKDTEFSLDNHNDAKGISFNDISTLHGGQSYLYNEMDSITYENAVDPAVKLNFSAVFSQVDEEKDRSLNISNNVYVFERDASEDGFVKHPDSLAHAVRVEAQDNAVRDFNESIIDENNYTADADFESESDMDAKEGFALEERMLSLSHESYDHMNADSFLVDGLDVAEEVGDDADMVVGLDISILSSSISRRQTERSKINEEEDFDGGKALASTHSLERPDAMINNIIRRSEEANAAADTNKFDEVNYNFPSAEMTAYFNQLAQVAHSFATTKSLSDKKQLLTATRKKAFGSKLDTLFNAHAAMWQYHMQTPEFPQSGSASDSDLVVHPSKLAGTLIDALVVIEQSLDCSLTQLSDLCSEKVQKISEEKIFFTFSALNVIANSCKIVQAFLNLSEGLLKHVVQQDFAVLNRKMIHSERIWNQVLAACSSLLGLFVLIPIEEELYSFPSVKSFLEQYRSSSGGGIELELAYGSVIGLSVSDRWCLVTLVGEVLKECNNLRSDHSTTTHDKSSTTLASESASTNQVSLNALSSLAKVFASSSPDLFNMLLAQQLPSILCESIFVDNSSPSKTHLQQRQKDANQQASSPGFAFVKTVNARVVHTLSVLLQSSHNAVYPTPLETVMLQRQRKRPSSAADQNDPRPSVPIDFEGASTHVMLRQRVCRLLGERFTDRNCKKLNAVLDMLFETFSPRLSSLAIEKTPSHRSNKTPHPVEESDVYNVFLLRADVLTVLIHVSYFFGRYVCLSICQYFNGSVVSALINSIGADEAMLGTSSEAHQRQLMQCIGHTKALSLQLLRYLCMYSTLQESHLLASVNACVECFNDDMNTGDKKISGCALSLLACIYKFSMLKVEVASDFSTAGNQSSMKVRSLLSYIERTLVSSKVLDVIVDLLSYLFTSSEKESRIEQSKTDLWNNASYSFGNNESQAGKPCTKGDARFWVLGSEFGLRQHGMLDGVLELLSLIGASAESRDDDLRRFMTGSLAMSLAEMICQQIQCTVSCFLHEMRLLIWHYSNLILLVAHRDPERFLLWANYMPCAICRPISVC